MIVILDYGMGNPGSILNMVRKAGGEALVSARHEDVRAASGLILPGVGAFDNGMEKLQSLGLIRVLEERVLLAKVPFLGICLGMQLMFQGSEEGMLPGLGWLRGHVRRFDFSTAPDGRRLKIPHMGWNVARPVTHESLFSNLRDEARFYFVHSYHACCDDPQDVLATCRYGYDFTCAVQRGNLFGCQFHPEKSHRFGLALVSSFIGVVRC